MIGPMRRGLKDFPCDETCEWVPTGKVRDGERIFECLGCESEWVRSSNFKPLDADGTVNEQVQAELDRA